MSKAHPGRNEPPEENVYQPLPPYQPLGSQASANRQSPPERFINRGDGRLAHRHPQATTVLMLGILSLFFCQLLGVFAWAKGQQVLAEIDANPGKFEGRGEVQAGRIMGIAASVLVVLALIAITLIVVLALAIDLPADDTQALALLSGQRLDIGLI